MRTLKFKKDHAVEYRDGRVMLCHAGIVWDIPDEEAGELLEAGIVEEIGSNPDNTGVVNRVELYEKKFGRSQLQRLCDEYDIPYKSTTHRTKVDYIQSILEYERTHNIDLLEDK